MAFVAKTKRRFVQIGERLVQARKAKGLLQTDAAQKLNLPGSRALWRYESGTNKPPAEVLADMARLYGVSTDWMLAGGDGGAPTALPTADVHGGEVELTALRELAFRLRLTDPQRAALDAHLDEIRRYTRPTIADAERYAQRLVGSTTANAIAAPKSSRKR